jgi:Kef-type K+ transport system membrane component KefB
MSVAPSTRRPLPTAALYLLLVALAVGGFLVVERIGLRVGAAPAPASGAAHYNPAEAGHRTSALLHVLLALPVIIVTARALGAVFRRLGQPPVVGEVIAGIVLGPSLLGHVWPDGAAYLLPASAAPLLQILAQVGVILFMFLVGLELNAQRLRHESHTTVAISHASIVVPFLLGSVLALWLYPRFSTSDVPFTVFALFTGVSMSVTAFPVLARILTDRGIQATPLGVIALTCAAVDDVSAWCLLAFVVSLARAQATDALSTVGFALIFVVVMVWAVRPLMGMLVRRTSRSGGLTQDVIAIVVVALLLSALATEAIGIHALFGAFLLGAIIAHDSLIAKELGRRLNDIVVILFLPAFFAYTGMRTQIGLLDSAGEWLWCAVIVAVACLGKFGGSAIAARFTGLRWRDAAALGVLMNTRGLMELIVLNIGLDLGVLSPKLFTMLVVMAVLTTMMTAPVLHLLTRGRDASNAEALV